MKVLILTESFAPTVAGPSERAVAISRLLRNAGHRVDVLTMRPFGGNSAKDYEALEYADSVLYAGGDGIRNLKYNKKFKLVSALNNWFVSLPGPYWIESVLLWRKFKKVAIANHWDVMWVTSPPHEVHNAAIKIKSEYGIPYVMDLRDPWVGGKRIRTRSKIHDWFTSRLFSKAIKAADSIVTNTPGFYSEFVGQNPQSASRTFCIPNGYFEQDAVGLASYLAVESKSVFKLVYSGSAYQGVVPDKIELVIDRLNCLDLLIDAEVIGPLRHSRQYKSLGSLSPHASMGHVMSSDLLFLHMPYDAEGQSVMSLKSYIYARSGAIILYSGPKNETSDFLERYSKVYYLDYGIDWGEVAAALKQGRDSNRKISQNDIVDQSWESRMTVINEILQSLGT